MKLLCCHNRYQLRAGEDIAFDTAVRLWRDAGHEVRTFERDNSRISEDGPAGQLRAARRAVFDPDVYRDLTSLAAAFRPDVAIVQNTFPLLSLAPYRVFRDRGPPVVQVVYNYRFLCLNGELYTGGAVCERCAGGNFLHGVIRRCYRDGVFASLIAARVAFANRREKVWEQGIARFVVPDHFLAEKLKQYGLKGEYRVIANPTVIPPAQDPPTHDGTVLYVGRWTRPKGVLTLLEAAGLDGVPPLVMVGDGEARADVEAHPAVRAGRVRLLGRLYGSALEEHLRSVMAVVVPSEWYDNLPMIVSQAFAFGRPVVASRINGIPEYVRDGENGLLFPPGDAGKLAEALRAIGADHSRWCRMAAGARGTAEREMAESRWQTRWGEVFQELAS